ncbi:MAG: T9SS type A sorting domain-containing protein [Chitinivibrionales bacterium]
MESLSGILIPLYVFILTLFTGITADTSDVFHNLLFGHSFFKGSHWQISGDTLNYDIDSGFSAYTVEEICFAGSGDTNIVLFSAEDASLNFTTSYISPGASFAAYPTITVGRPTEYTGGGERGVFTLVPLGGGTPDSVAVAYPSESGIVLDIVLTDNYSILDSDTLFSARPYNDSLINTMNGFYSDENGPVLLAGGDQGYVRRFVYSNGGWSSEVNLDIDQTESVTAVCSTALGCASGAIYEYNGNSFSYSSNPCTTEVVYINGRGALCRGGYVVENDQDTWIPYSFGTGDYKRFNFIVRDDGLGVELLDPEWRFSKFTLNDTETSMSFEPEFIEDYVGSEYLRNSDFDSLFIRLSDNEGNYRVPDITISSLNGNLLVSDGDTLSGFNPDTTAETGVVQVTDSLIKVAFTEDSVVLTAPCRFGYFDPVSNKNYWMYSTFRSSSDWREEGVLRIEMNDTLLEVVNDHSTKAGYDPDIKALNRRRGFRFRGNSLEVFQHSTVKFRVYALDGRVVMQKRVKKASGKAEVIPLDIAPGVYILKAEILNQETGTYTTAQRKFSITR